jgi:uncharacterized metal-binding protein YceD (DUF177 family)
VKINLRTLPEEGTTLQGTLAPGPYDLPCEPDQSWAPIEYRLFVQILGKECLVAGTLKTTLLTPCARCLEPLQHPIEVVQFEHTFEVENMETIDLTLQIREDIVLGLPLVIRCVLEADGRCPVTGRYPGLKTDPESPSLQEDIWGALDQWKEK